jgi:hypothetical protein
LRSFFDRLISEEDRKFVDQDSNGE